MDYMDFAIIGDAEASMKDGVLMFRVDLRPPSNSRRSQARFSTPGRSSSRWEPAIVTAMITDSCGRSSVGRAQPCQGWGRQFESGRPLHAIPGQGPASAGLFQFSGDALLSRSAVRASSSQESAVDACGGRILRRAAPRKPAAVAGGASGVTSEWCGAGSIPFVLRTRQTVEEASWWPRLVEFALDTPVGPRRVL